jgi:hypothetical protein
MAKYHVCCLLPNASGNINGIDFITDEPSGSMITEFPIEAEQAMGFRGIGGFVVVEVSKEDEDALIAAVKAAEQARGNASRAASAAAAKARAEKAAEPSDPAIVEEPVPPALAATAAGIVADTAAEAAGEPIPERQAPAPIPPPEPIDPEEAEKERQAILASQITPAPTAEAEAAGAAGLTSELTRAVGDVVSSGGEPVVDLMKGSHLEGAAPPPTPELF